MFSVTDHLVTSLANLIILAMLDVAIDSDMKY